MILVGLGNPGKEYEGTRHNVGFMVVDRLVEGWGGRWEMNKKVDSQISKLHDPESSSGRHGLGFQGMSITISNKVVHAYVLKPMTFMNRSGEAVRKMIEYFGEEILSDGMILVHDDVDLELGRIKIQFGGGHAGHNGVRSIYDGISKLQDPESSSGRHGLGFQGMSISISNVIRFRCGVGRPGEQVSSMKYDVSREVQNTKQQGVTDWVLGRFSRKEQEVVDEMVARCVGGVDVAIREGVEQARLKVNHD